MHKSVCLSTYILHICHRISRTALCQETSEIDIGDQMSQLTMGSLWGVFWIIYYGFIVSAVFLVFEWILSGMMAVQPGVEGVRIIQEYLTRLR